MPPRRFSLAEAEGLLSRLTRLLQEMREQKLEHDRLRRAAAELESKMKSDGHLLDNELRRAREGIERTAREVNGLIEQAQELGCEVKDIDMGLVDFRTEIDGREVYLCWKLGEERIRWWHELGAGFASRRPLDPGGGDD